MEPLSRLADARPVFILSTARSGSTLLRLTLGKVPSVVSLPESHFLLFREKHLLHELHKRSYREEVADAWCEFGRIRKWPIDRAALREEIVEHAESWADLLEVTVARYVAETAPDTPAAFVWCEKSPPHVFRRAKLRELFPAARFLHLVRDPRDVAASLKTCPWATSNVYTSARVWAKAARVVTPAEDTLQVRYERLVEDPRGEVHRICAFLGVEFDPTALDAPTEDAVEARNVRSKASLEEISPRYAGIWRERLSRPDRDLEVIQHVCAAAMQRLGYERAGERRDLRFRARLVIGWTGLAAQRVFDR